MKNMNLPLIAAAVRGRLFIDGSEADIDSEKVSQEYSGLLGTEAEGVVIDSRICGKDHIFVATKGERTDGHAYMESVLENGALGVICESLPENFSEKRPKGAFILVEDSFKALKMLAAYYRKQLDIKIVGIIGSVGKTSTKELVASVLSKQFRVLKTDGNFNNEIGVPLTLFRIKDEHEIAVVEMGISGFGEMDRLGEIVEPDIVIMTNIGPCHLENLKDLDGVLRAKSEVIRHIKKDGLIILNTDDPKLLSLKKLKEGTAENINIIDDVDRYVLEHINVASFGSDADVSYIDLVNKGVNGSSFTIDFKPEKNPIYKNLSCSDGFTVSCSVHLQGTHMVFNALAACTVGLIKGMRIEQIIKGISETLPMKGRCCPIKTDKYLVVDDSYNANPKSMMAAADLLDESSGRKVMILGDMFELGDDEKSLHYDVGRYIASKNIEKIVCVGSLSECVYNGYSEKISENGSENRAVYYKTKEDLLLNLNSLGLSDGDIVLVKASHGMGFSEVVEKLVDAGNVCRFVKGKEFMQIDDIMQLLSQTHWACNRSRETVEKAIENSLCFGIIDENGKQIAFGRTVTDYATMFYVSDVVIDKDHQKRGLGGKFVNFIKSAPEHKDLWGFLGTTKAWGFYSRFGFEKKDDFFMALPKTNVRGIFNV